MDFQQASILLRKINMLFESLQADEDHVTAIERDLMRSHLRQLYDQFLPDTDTAKPAPKPVKARSPKVEVIKRTPARKATPPVPTPPPAPSYEAPRIIELDEELEDMVAETPPPPPPAPKPRPKPTPPPAPKPVAKATPVAPPPAANAELDEEVEALFAMKKGNDLSSKLSETAIKDLTRAMGLNERFLTRDELFGGSQQSLDTALKTLNGMSSFAEAKQWLAAHPIAQYDWTSKDKKKKAQIFIKLVRRRFN